MRRALLIVAALSLALALPGGASAHTYPLSKRYASDIASSYATREAHRIWRLRDIGVEAESSMCRRHSPTVVACAMKVSLYWDGTAAPPTEVEGTLAVHRLASGRLTIRLTKDWEVLPPPSEEESAAESKDNEQWIAGVERKERDETAQFAKQEAEQGEPCAAAILEPSIPAYATECSAQRHHLEEAQHKLEAEIAEGR